MAALNIQIKLNISNLHSWDLHKHFAQVCSKCNILKQWRLLGTVSGEMGQPLCFHPSPFDAILCQASDHSQAGGLWPALNRSAFVSPAQMSLFFMREWAKRVLTQHDRLFVACPSGGERQVPPLFSCWNASAEQTVEQAVKQFKSL